MPKGKFSCTNLCYVCLGQTTGSTHVESSLKEMTFGNAPRKPAILPPLREPHTKRRLECDETVFKVYKGVRTFDFCKEKNVIATGGNVP